jgi:hypothetical protein
MEAMISVASVMGGQRERLMGERLMGTSSGGEYKGVGGQATRKGRRHKLEDLRSPVALFYNYNCFA